MKRSSAAGLNKARYEKGFQYLDLNSVLGIFFKKLSGLQKYQHFLFEAARPGVVKAQLVANGTYTEFNLLKIKKSSVSEITKKIKPFSILVLVLIPPPLDYRRQEYLYHNIYPFVRMNSKISLVQNQSNLHCQ